jgi:NAD(P)-dependent dehydrogenase (short-subunit alcohol dehydrogenase family)
VARLRPLDQQVVVLTGASSGIGLSTARLAAQRGARLVLAARNEAALRELCDELNAGGERRAVAVPADVAREEDVARIAETAVAEFGHFDTWVNNAAVSVFGETTQVTIEDFRRVFDVVFWSVVYGCRQAVAHYRCRADGHGVGGAVVNVGSLFGDRATPLQSTYGSAKHAVHGFTDSLRMELAHHGDPIAVTLVHPGRIDTPYNEHAQSYLDHQPAHHGVVYPPDAVAQAIVYSAAHGPRDVFVGSQAKITALAGALFPRLVDWYMEHHMWPSQMADDRPSQSREAPGSPQTTAALWTAGYGMHERGSNEGWHRRRSYAVAARTHPVRTLVGTGVGALGLVAARATWASRR